MTVNIPFSEAALQIAQYFKNPRFKFTVAYELHGTPLQIKIWQALTKIPVGKTVTYNDLAKQLGTSPRVIGNACRNNPLPIIIPCHRAVATNGNGGFCGTTSGKMLELKQWLLAHEQQAN